MKRNKFILLSHGQGESQSLLLPIICFLISTALALFCYWVSQYEWAAWFWDVYKWIYGVLSIVATMLILVIYLEE
jgi:hypothetical protein